MDDIVIDAYGTESKDDDLLKDDMHIQQDLHRRIKGICGRVFQCRACRHTEDLLYVYMLYIERL